MGEQVGLSTPRTVTPLPQPVETPVVPADTGTVDATGGSVTTGGGADPAAIFESGTGARPGELRPMRPKPLDAAFIGADGNVRINAHVAVGTPDNGFGYTATNIDPIPVGGTAWQQTVQGAMMVGLADDAVQHSVSGGRLPPDFLLRAILKNHEPTPPIATDPIATTDYTSTIPGVCPREAYATFVNDPTGVFGAAGLDIRPPVNRLTNGAKLFLHDGGPPPVFAPIQVELDPANNTVRITTLDGHPLRGTNNFQFTSDGNGGTRILQESTFQLSSMAGKIGELLGAVNRQHEIWQSVHQQIFDQTRAANGGDR